MTNSTKFRGTIQGRTLVVLERAAPLPDGTPVEVSPLDHEAASASALVAAMEAEPHLSAEDIAELNKAIAAGKRPAASIDPFSADTSGPA